MSASREKKARQELGADYVSPKEEKARKEKADSRRSTIIFTVCAAVFVIGVIVMALWNSGVIQRSAAAARVNGVTYNASDVAFYYYNGRANLLNNGSYDIDSSKSLRKQEHTAGAGTWFDYLASNSIQSLANAAVLAQAAKDAGFDGGSEVTETVKTAMSNFESAAATNGYTLNQYIKAIYGPLMTRASLERNLRMTALADAYVEYLSSPANYTEADFNSAYESDPNSYCLVSFESAVFYSGNYLTDTESTESATGTEGTTTAEGDDDVRTQAALAASQEAAASLLGRFKSGESFETVSEELGASYSANKTYYGESELASWLFDDARRDGDTTVMDFYGSGTQAVVFHSKQRADYHTVDIRHILVEDEETANSLLAQFNAGDKSEDSFAALAEENSTDTGSSSNGGLYEGVYVGQMVEPFENWCFDESRQTGDTGIVKTDYGYHVMYFVGRGEYPYWQMMVASKRANTESENLTKDISTEQLSGMKYIDT